MNEINSKLQFDELKNNLDTNGYLYKVFDNFSNAMSFSHNFASYLGKNYTAYILESKGDENILPHHTEMLYVEDIPQYFALVMNKQARVGGELSIIDSRKLYEKIKLEFSNNPNMYIGITSKQRGGFIKRQLLPEDDNLPMVCYSETESVTFLGVTTEESENVKNKIKNLINESSLCILKQENNSVLFVNNFKTLHGRMPFIGERMLLRIRVNDPSWKGN